MQAKVYRPGNINSLFNNTFCTKRKAQKAKNCKTNLKPDFFLYNKLS